MKLTGPYFSFAAQVIKITVWLNRPMSLYTVPQSQLNANAAHWYEAFGCHLSFVCVLKAESRNFLLPKALI